MKEIHISVSTTGASSVIKVDGALMHEGLAELERVIAPLEGPLRLDLSELRSLDEEGLAAIQALGGGGLRSWAPRPTSPCSSDPVTPCKGNDEGRLRTNRSDQ